MLARGILRVVAAVVLLWVLLVVALLAWSIYREPIAKKQATDFCATVKVGDSMEGIAERAIETGAEERYAKWRRLQDGSLEMDVMYIGMPPFSMHICVIKAGEVVTSTSYEHDD